MKLLGFLVFYCWVWAAHAIVGGEPLTLKQSETFAAFVSLGEDRNLGGGVHIGDGIILTAEHVFYLDFVNITIRNIHGHTIAEFPYDRNTQVKVIPAVEFQEAEIKVQIPDLAILIPPDHIRNKLRKLPIAKLTNETQFQGKNLFVVGIGMISFNDDPNPTFGIPRIGKFRAIEIEKSNFFIQTEHNEKKTQAAAAPGDSGSPIWLINKNGEPEVVGITFTLSPPNPKTNTPAQNLFTKINTPEVKNWFQSLEKSILNPTCQKTLK